MQRLKSLLIGAILLTVARAWMPRPDPKPTPRRLSKI